MRVAVLGTGIMGTGIARSLRRSGHDVTAWNRTKSRAERLQEDGIAVTGTLAEAVADADAALTIMFDTEATLGVCDELANALPHDAVWIQSATLGPDGVRQVAERAGRKLVDAPVLGTKKPAAEGKLVVLASGDPSLLERSKPVFDAIGSRTLVVSDRIGDASALKLVCNAWIGTITVGTAQSLAFAQRLGLDPRLFLEAIAGTPTDSAYAQLKGNAVLAGDYATSFAVDGVVKDVELMIDAAESAQFPTDLLDTVRILFARASAAGHGEEDMAAARFAFPPA